MALSTGSRLTKLARLARGDFDHVLSRRTGSYKNGGVATRYSSYSSAYLGLALSDTAHALYG